MNNYEIKLDRRRKYFLILDCETATMPYASKFEGAQKQKIALAKPLIYDLGWQIVDRNGNVYAKRNFLITEIFSVPSIFNTAHYKAKRPMYLEMLRNGEIDLVDWQTATAVLTADLEKVTDTGAYNSMFDYKKAIPFTDLYISKLYSPDFNEWEKMQNGFIDRIVNERNDKPSREFDPDHFNFRGNNYPMFDLWGLACNHLLNCDNYREMCNEFGWISASGKYYTTSAETTYRFLKGNADFIESHTALNDAEIETEIFAEIIKKAGLNFERGIEYFPFRVVGRADI
jgi:hypothetical protein